MTDIKSRLDQWLRDAHAMEEQAETLLAGQISRIESFPELKTRLEQHLNETKSQAERIAACLERRGTSSSSIKDLGGKFSAAMQNFGGVFMDDEVVKGALASYTFEQLEIASYKILVSASEADGDHDTAEVCKTICREEEEMAQWLLNYLPQLTTKHLTREQVSSDTAKR